MKEEMLKYLLGSAENFYSVLQEMKASTALNKKLLDFVEILHPDIEYSHSIKKLLLIFFSLSNDGNTCISLNPNNLLKKWETKWNGLILQQLSYSELKESDFPSIEDFREIINCGCRELLSLDAKNLEPLVIEKINNEPFLFAKKYFDAKKNIENCFSNPNIFSDGCDTTPKELENTANKIESLITQQAKSFFKLKPAQIEAITRGEKQNLIITGGPGTGKTTVVFFLLWNLLQSKPELQQWDIYFTAPSGKAADRLRESLEECKNLLSEESLKEPTTQKLSQIEKSTLHGLLKFQPRENTFTYRKNNPFPEKSIFVIDEASMIDIALFSSFLEALPKKDFRLFILGDKDQLPSVDAGAVLGELLDLGKKCVVRLTESNRFNDNSEIGRLAKSIQDLNAPLPNFSTWESSTNLWPKENDVINFIRLAEKESDLKKKDEEEKLQEILELWVNKFYKNLTPVAEKIHSSINEKNFSENGFSENDWEQEVKNRHSLWEIAESARILSAEKRGLRGIENINKMILNILKQKNPFSFNGSLLMLNKNLNFLNLQNGDSGIIVNAKTQPSLMLKRKNDFLFFPLFQLPTDCLQSAFAITIHKSQGSGYKNIMMFLPKYSGHPLLNRQILYTGITRTKKESLTIIASHETFKSAKETLIQRDSGITI